MDTKSANVSGQSTSQNDTFGAEEIAYTIWATAHGMAVQTHLAGFEADFASIHMEALQRLLTGLAAEPYKPTNTTPTKTYDADRHPSTPQMRTTG